jgi:beta-lactamase superfamily II metal-dependent hydrolase
VIDCNSASRDPDQNHTVAFLKEQNVTELAFVCLTHPHADHYSGMFHLFEQFRVNGFWSFHTARPGRMSLLFRVVDYETTREAKGRPDVSENRVGHFKRLLDAVKNAKARPEFTQKYIQERLDVYPLKIGIGGDVPPGSVHIRALAPTDETIDRYFKRVNDWFDEKGDIRSGKLPAIDHNEMSIVFRLRYGPATVFLCADLERRNWEAVMARYIPSDPNAFSADVVKVSHHGSMTGRCEGLWGAFAAGKHPLCVVTPSEAHSLPDPELLSEISDHGSEVWLCSDSGGPTILSSAEMRAKFGAITGAHLSELVQDFARFQQPRLGRCSIEVSASGAVNCRGHGSAFRLTARPNRPPR